MPLARLHSITLRMTHPVVMVVLLLLMQVQNLMPMLELLSEDRTQLGESVYLDEAPKEHPMAPNQAFLSKLAKSSHLLEIILSVRLVEQFIQLLVLNKEVKL